jgi:SAM-dependent methyltransferase
MLDSEVESFVLEALPPPPARVLEVGAGAGELAEALESAGYEVVAIDPASERPEVRPVALHELWEPPASFDAAVAVVSLHHVEPFRESCRRLSELVRLGGTLAIDEFDVECLDERAATWWLGERASCKHAARSPAEVVADLRDHCHSLKTIRATLAEWFELGAVTRGPYLYRWDLPPGLRSAEEELIDVGQLSATGARLVGTRR